MLDGILESLLEISMLKGSDFLCYCRELASELYSTVSFNLTCQFVIGSIGMDVRDL